ncbi:MAG: homoserine kinase [Magnetococcus sp. DMHC-1]|nr:homoserine kinase [Magnetococcales bacterium]
MSVYTPLSVADLEPFLQGYAIGRPLRLEGILLGVDNSNFFLDTEQGRFVLTLVEDAIQARDMEHLLRLTTWLADRHIPAPRPLPDRHGQLLHQIQSRTALLVTCLPGAHALAPTPAHCTQAGALLARIHLAGQDFPNPRPNPMGPPACRRLLERLQPVLARDDPTTLDLLTTELTTLEESFFRLDLPGGVCHGDLFPDNVLFADLVPVGVIDFHYACLERWLYDLAIALTAWGFDANGNHLPDQFAALEQGYQTVRPLTREENLWKNAASRAASIRFLLTRLRDQAFPRQGQTITHKSPAPYLKRLQFFQKSR